MPRPIAKAPPLIHAKRTRPQEAAVRPAKSRAAYEAHMAMTTERITKRGS
jgi:hypothetical protein